MKILYIVTHSEAGGAQQYVFTCARAFTKMGVDVTVGTGAEGWLTIQLKKNGIPFVIFRRLKRTYNPLKNIFFSYEIKKFFSKKHFDIAHFNSSNSFFGVFGAHFAKSKPRIVFTFHGLSLLHHHWTGLYFVKALYYFILLFAMPLIDKSIFVCKQDKDYLLKKNIIRDAQKTAVIYNGIAPQTYFFYTKERAKHILKEEFGVLAPPDKTIIGAIARFTYQKNIEMLVRVAAHIRDMPIHFLLFGFGPQKQSIERAITQNGMNEFFTIAEIPEPARFIRAFDVFACTSRYEGFPFAILEAMAGGVPVVSVAAGGIGECISSMENGVLTDNNSKEMAKAMRNILTQPHIREKLIKNARQTIQDLMSEERMIKQTEQCYKEICKKF